MADGTGTTRVVVGAPGDPGLERGRLVTGEEQRRAVEEDADPPSRPEQFEPLEDPQAVDPFLAAQAAQRLGEAHAHRVRRPGADVLQHEEEQAVLELEVEDHVAFLVLRGGSGHVVSLDVQCRACNPAFSSWIRRYERSSPAPPRRPAWAACRSDV